jgi:hypothetical protein
MVREKAIFGQSKVVTMNRIILLRFPHGMSPPGRHHVTKLRLPVKHASTMVGESSIAPIELPQVGQNARLE